MLIPVIIQDDTIGRITAQVFHGDGIFHFSAIDCRATGDLKCHCFFNTDILCSRVRVRARARTIRCGIIVRDRTAGLITCCKRKLVAAQRTADTTPVTGDVSAGTAFTQGIYTWQHDRIGYGLTSLDPAANHRAGSPQCPGGIKLVSIIVIDNIFQQGKSYIGGRVNQIVIGNGTYEVFTFIQADYSTQGIRAFCIPGDADKYIICQKGFINHQRRIGRILIGHP